MSFQTMIFVGNLGKDPEMRYTPSGQPVTSFSVAVSRQYKGSDGNLKKETIWFRVSAWGKLAETCSNYLHKGSKVLVEGRLVPAENGGPRVFTRQDGTPGANYDINAQTVNFLSTKAESGEQSSSDEVADVAPTEEDSIPF